MVVVFDCYKQFYSNSFILRLTLNLFVCKHILSTYALFATFGLHAWVHANYWKQLYLLVREYSLSYFILWFRVILCHLFLPISSMISFCCIYHQGLIQDCYEGGGYSWGVGVLCQKHTCVGGVAWGHAPTEI